MAQSRSSKYFNVLGEQVAKRTVYLGIVSLLIVIGGVGGLLYYLLLQGREAVTPVETVPAASVDTPLEIAKTPAAEVVAEPIVSQPASMSEGELSTRSSLVKLLERHIQAMQFGDLDSLIVNGSASADTVTCDVTIMAHRPNLYKLKTEAVGADYTSQYGYDGQQGWFKQDSVELDQDAVEFFMRVALFESSVAHLAWSYQSDEALEFGLDKVLERLPDEHWQGQACAVVVSRSILPFPIYHYIDKQSSEEVYRRAQVLKGTELVNLEIHFASSEAQLSPRLPMGYELYFDGELHDTVKFTKVRENRVLLSSLFDAPSIASATGLSSRP